MCHTCVKDPKDRPLGSNILIIRNEVGLLPSIAKEPIYVSATQIIGSVEPVGSENTHFYLDGSTLSGGVQCVEEGGSIVPLEVVEDRTQLVLDDVEVSTVGPVVPEVDQLEGSGVVHHQNGVELVGPWGWRWVFF